VSDAAPLPQSTQPFPGFARWCEQQVARPGASVAALIFIGSWLVAGPFYGWSSGWHLIINTTSSVITLVMVFMIQNTRRRDTQAIQLHLHWIPAAGAEVEEGIHMARQALAVARDNPEVLRVAGFALAAFGGENQTALTAINRANRTQSELRNHL